MKLQQDAQIPLLFPPSRHLKNRISVKNTQCELSTVCLREQGNHRVAILKPSVEGTDAKIVTTFLFIHLHGPTFIFLCVRRPDHTHLQPHNE